MLILLNSIRQIHTANPIELVTAGNAGEREPKTKWVLAILGLLSLCLLYTSNSEKQHLNIYIKVYRQISAYFLQNFFIVSIPIINYIHL